MGQVLESVKSLGLYITVWSLNSSQQYVPTAIVDQIENLQLVYKWVDPNTIRLTVAYSATLAQQLIVNNLLTIHANRVFNGVDTEPFLITYRQLQETSNGVRTITIKGSNPLIWLKRRTYKIVCDYGDIIPPEQVVTTAIENVCVSPLVANRALPNFNINFNYPLSNPIIPLYFEEPAYNLFTYCKNVLNTVNAGQTVSFALLDIDNIQAGQFYYNIRAGINRSMNQNVNLSIIFSPTQDNIASNSFTHSLVNFANVATVYGQIGNNYYFEDVGNTTASGYARYETLCDAFLPTGQNATTLTTSNYKSIFQTLGEQKLITQAETQHTIGNLTVNCPFEFKTDFDVGDTVTYYYPEWGVNIDVEITEVRLQFSSKGFTTQVSLGQPLPTLIDKFGVDI